MNGHDNKIMTKTIDLPTPDADALAHSEQLQQKIRAAIAATDNTVNAISFADYMQMALYEPGLGYYQAGAKKIGADGDFITAPELSALFSECLANQLTQVLSVAGGDILELGAGSGAMARDILRYLAEQQQLPDHYFIVELSAELQDQQRNTLQPYPELLERVQWLSAWPEQPLTGAVIANEVLDAMPVELFQYESSGLQQVCVTTADADTTELGFTWQLQSASPALQQAVDRLGIDFSPGYLSEINLFLSGWIASIAQCLKQGVVLLVDYGFPRHEYYHPDRHQGTVMCHYRHRAHPDPFFYPGLQDITAHVDFTAVAEAAVVAGLSVGGFTHQAGFLMNCGLLSRMAASQDDPYALNQQVKQLTLPSEMGELFKVMALTQGFDQPLLGFSTMDQRHRL